MGFMMFFPTEHKKVVDVYHKVTSSSFNNAWQLQCATVRQGVTIFSIPQCDFNPCQILSWQTILNTLWGNFGALGDMTFKGRKTKWWIMNQSHLSTHAHTCSSSVPRHVLEKICKHRFQLELKDAVKKYWCKALISKSNYIKQKDTIRKACI